MDNQSLPQMTNFFFHVLKTNFSLLKLIKMIKKNNIYQIKRGLHYFITHILYNFSLYFIYSVIGSLVNLQDLNLVLKTLPNVTPTENIIS